MTAASKNSFSTRATLRVGKDSFEIYRLESLASSKVGNVARLPFSLKVLLENLLRQEDDRFVHADDIRALAAWDPTSAGGATEKEISFMPARVLLQDFTGVPGGGRSGGDARRDPQPGRRSEENQSAAAGGAGDRSLRAGGQIRLGEFVRVQRRTRISAQHRALRVSALGTEELAEFQSGPAGYRHLPPGESGISGARRSSAPNRTARCSPSPIRWWAPIRTRRW